MMLQKKFILFFVVLIYCSVFVAGYQRVGYETAYVCSVAWDVAQPCSNIVDRDMGTYGG